MFTKLTWPNNVPAAPAQKAKPDIRAREELPTAADGRHQTGRKKVIDLTFAVEGEIN